MKAQFAVAESVTSILLAIFAITYTTNAMNSATLTLFTQKSALISNFAIYDLINQLDFNGSTKLCVENLSSSNSTCLSNLFLIYNKLYKVNIAAKAPNISLGYVNSPLVQTCIYYGKRNSTLCIEVGD
ncbi:MAG: hypothetical protein KGH59_00830 [Candidatus Micrarchaeota archaeon]|nr:hypothetical protein [Candidatus Micrarchaeota archaeon]MDE1846507.1 hypothetical protein [Candidatus Micrarchaeota archaeon]